MDLRVPVDRQRVEVRRHFVPLGRIAGQRAGRITSYNVCYTKLLRILRLEDVVQAEERGRVLGVELDDDLVGQAQVGVGHADRSGQDDAAAGGQVTGFDDGPVDLAEEAVSYNFV